MGEISRDSHMNDLDHLEDCGNVDIVLKLARYAGFDLAELYVDQLH